MSRVLITGSSRGLGALTARRLAADGHEITLHARDARRVNSARAAVPTARAVLVGDLTDVAGMRAVGRQAAGLGRHDAVVHNAGVGFREPQRVRTADGLCHVFAINVLAPYVLTAVIDPPDRLVFVSSGMHRGSARYTADTGAELADPQWNVRPWDAVEAYSESKLLAVVLAFAVARRWPYVQCNALEPGWVPTRLGGSAGPDDLALASVTQAWLAVSDDLEAAVSGGYFHHQRPRESHPATQSHALQDSLLDYCAGLSGIPFPDRAGA
jgi:NAD(P)-dependent dehydrogenase (short-subunit alcohol dehydrogenase family)